jgi:ADP-heptose:LPS heptosyltransferase
MDSSGATRWSLVEPAPRRIGVLQTLWLGNMLCAVPAVRALRNRLPDAHITLIGLPWARLFVVRFSGYFDDVLELPGYPGLPEQPSDARRFPAFLHRAHEARFDRTIQMHGSGAITNPLSMLLGARHTAGFYVPGQLCPDPRTFLPYPEHEPEFRQNLQLMKFLGIPLDDQELEFPLTDEDRDELAAVPEAGVQELLSASRDGHAAGMREQQELQREEGVYA